jgi:hypothetical protein
VQAALEAIPAKPTGLPISEQDFRKSYNLLDPPIVSISEGRTPTMAVGESPLAEPFLIPEKDVEEDSAIMESQSQLLLPQVDKGASFSQGCLNLSNVILGMFSRWRRSVLRSLRHRFLTHAPQPVQLDLVGIIWAGHINYVN